MGYCLINVPRGMGRGIHAPLRGALGCSDELSCGILCSRVFSILMNRSRCCNILKYMVNILKNMASICKFPRISGEFWKNLGKFVNFAPILRKTERFVKIFEDFRLASIKMEHLGNKYTRVLRYIGIYSFRGSLRIAGYSSYPKEVR